MKRAVILICGLLLLVSVGNHAWHGLRAQAQQPGCDPTGTWYGGSGDLSMPYHMTIANIGGGSYAVRLQSPINLSASGYLGMTDWTGEMVKGAGQKYDFYIVSFDNLAPELAEAFGGSLDMDIVHSTVQFSNGCSMLLSSIDTFGGYIPWTEDKAPFVTALDYNYFEIFFGGAKTIEERYYRMPTFCPTCPSVGPGSKSMSHVNTWKFPRKR